MTWMARRHTFQRKPFVYNVLPIAPYSTQFIHHLVWLHDGEGLVVSSLLDSYLILLLHHDTVSVSDQLIFRTVQTSIWSRLADLIDILHVNEILAVMIDTRSVLGTRRQLDAMSAF